MIKIEITDKGILDLQGTTGLSFELISPLFKKEVAQTGYSYPIEVPLTDNNRKLLGFLDRLDIDNEIESLPCRISYNNIALVDGTLNISSIAPDGARASCFVLGYEFDVALLDTPLRQVPMGGVRNIVPTLETQMYEHANALLDATSDTSDYCFFPIKNDSFYQDAPLMESAFNAPHTYSNIVNLWDFQKQSFFDPVSGNQITVDAALSAYTDAYPKQSCFCPFPFAVSVLKYIGLYLGGYAIDGDFLNDEAIKKLVVYNTTSLDSLGVFGVDFPLCKNNKDIDLSQHVPDITVNDFLTGLAQMFNLAIQLDSKNKHITINRKKLTLTSSDEIEYIFAPNSISISASANKTADGTTLILEADTSDTQQDILATITIDKNVLADDDSFDATDTVNTIRFAPTDYTGKINNGDATTDIPSGLSYKIGVGLLTQEIKAGTLPTVKNITINYAFFDQINPSVPTNYLSGIIPIANQIGNSDVYNVHEDYSLRFLFYAGTHTDPNSYGIYPIGTSNIYDDNGNTILPYSLKWRGGAHALYDAWHKDWEKILFGKKVQCNLMLSITDFLNLDLTKKIRLANRLYFIDRLQVPITHAGIGIVKATLVQIPL